MNNEHMHEIGIKIHKDREEILSFCKAHKRIHLYGMGYVANKMFKYLKEEGIDIYDVIVGDGHKSCDRYLDQYTVIELSDVRLDDEDGIIMGVRKEIQGYIMDNLEAKGIKKQHVYCQRIYLNNLSKKIVSDLYIGDSLCDQQNGYFSNYTELEEVGKFFGTDKSSELHNYLNKYEFFLNRWKDSEFVFLELGVLKAASIKMWGDYFKKATIYGVDIDPKCKAYEQKNTKIIISDLESEENLNKLGDLQPTIIVDDASHLWSHQIKAIYHLLPKLQSGGVYILEDLETSFPSYQYMDYDDAALTGYDFCSALAEVVTSREYLRHSTLDSMKITPLKNEIEFLAMQIEMISFIHGSCIIVKK